jgi:glutamate:Na+ symporter, ESS family
MTRDVSRFLAPDFLSLTIGIVVYFVGVLTTQRVKFLRNFSIPEPVSGGFIAVAAFSLIYFVFNLEIDFDLTTRDRLLVIFFLPSASIHGSPILWRAAGLCLSCV